MKTKTVILRNLQDKDGTRNLTAAINEQGDLLIHGIDAGPGVEQIFGFPEYEWIWTIKAAELPKLNRALGKDSPQANTLDLLKEQFSDERAANILEFFQQHQIIYESWSRIA